MSEYLIDANEVAPNTGEFEPLPNAVYPLALTSHESTKKPEDPNANWGFKMTFTVLDGDHKGKTIRTFLNYKHSNPQTVSIAQGELSALCHVTGVMKPRDLSELYNKPFLGDVVVTPPSTKMVNGEKKTYGEGNKIRKFLRIDGTSLSVSAGGASSATSKPAPATKSSAPGWAVPKAKAS